MNTARRRDWMADKILRPRIRARNGKVAPAAAAAFLEAVEDYTAKLADMCVRVLSEGNPRRGTLKEEHVKDALRRLNGGEASR